MTAWRSDARTFWRYNVLVTEPRICVVHSRKGGVGKTTLATELAWLLGAVLVDLDWEEGGATRAWGYRWEDRLRSPLLEALRKVEPPKPLTGYRKPDLVPGHPDFQTDEPPAEEMAEALSSWATSWGRPWVVVDTHPGATPATSGALSVAHVVVAPVPLAVKDLAGTEALVRELADYPLVLVPNKVRPVPRAAEVNRLRSIVAGTPVRVAAPIPLAAAVESRSRRMAITAEDPPAKALRPFAAALEQLATYIDDYTQETP